MTIEEHSETWKFIGPQLKNLNQKVVVERRLESFFSVASMALADYGHGLVPLGVAKMLGLSESQCFMFGTKVKRPISLLAKKTTWGRPIVAKFYKELMSNYTKWTS